jgi:hypothetical protein
MVTFPNTPPVVLSGSQQTAIFTPPTKKPSDSKVNGSFFEMAAVPPRATTYGIVSPTPSILGIRSGAEIGIQHETITYKVPSPHKQGEFISRSALKPIVFVDNPAPKTIAPPLGRPEERQDIAYFGPFPVLSNPQDGVTALGWAGLLSGGVKEVLDGLKVKNAISVKPSGGSYQITILVDKEDQEKLKQKAYEMGPKWIATAIALGNGKIAENRRQRKPVDSGHKTRPPEIDMPTIPHQNEESAFVKAITSLLTILFQDISKPAGT